MKKQKSFKAAIFDLGGVVFGISLEPVIQSWARSIGCQPQEIAAKFRIDSHYERFEIGEISPAQYRAHVCGVLGAHLSNEDFDQGWNSIYLEVLPGVETLLQQLRETVRLVALTNTNQIHAPAWRACYSGVLSYFERVFSSHEIRVRKPDPRSFQIVLDYLDMEPGKAVFIDDNPENVRGAEAVGIRGIIADNPFETVGKIRRLVIGAAE